MATDFGSSLLALCIGVIFAGILGYSWKNAFPRSLPYPPGPKGWPLIGNVLDVPKSYPWTVYRDWSRKYGTIVHLRVFGQSIVVLNTAKAVSDLLEARSANYSDRVRPVMVPLMGLDWNVAFMPYGSAWRQHRRAVHQYFDSDSIRGYEPVQLKTARQLLGHLRREPADFLNIINFMIGAGIIEITYGHIVQDANNPYLTLSRNGSVAASEGLVPGTFLVEFFPFLRHIPAWFPGAVFKRKAAEWKKTFRAMVEVPFNDARAAIESGEAVPSVVAHILDQLGDLKGDRETREIEVAQNSLAAVYAAGADTTFSTMQAFFLAMVLHPEVQKKAQLELDAVIGPGRLPDFSDRPSLPYITAIVKECIRWMPVIPLGIPHATMADDEYDGYLIPKGSVVIGNQWALLHDPEDYPEPDTFAPERFIKNEKLDPNVKDPSTAAFGFGRRSCAGREFAESTLFINIASILHAFHITPALDVFGRSMVPEPRATSGFLSHPIPFECLVKPRSPSAEHLINEWR
ncbi:cytochrome P450 [Obba rivulosa]|uniref:Cytochrome P450 n=1 Tax=Obba rivulosa TaxID=1052685 RepID=A0A8E2AP60_9APHY|nr:cytochrome P450 [Obba rivulosa]